MAFLFGIDVLLQKASAYKDIRAALVTNNAATTTGNEQSRIALLKKGFNIIKLFSPEHGLSAQGEDGAFQENGIDNITQLPVTSLYGNHLAPAEEDLSDIDIIFFDLPDVGCRFYTYQWTLSYIMESCALFNKPLIVLDRPNPISGNLSLAEGPMLNENCISFIGRWNIPLRHSLTIGELAMYWKAEKMLSLDLTLIPVQGWKREQFFSSLPVPFVPTSPGIADFTTALLYPGVGLLEGINVSEGRGTDSPFKICGAPWIDSNQLNEAFNELKLPGITSVPLSFIPTSGKYQNEECFGIKLAVTDQQSLRPVAMGLSLINLLFNLHPQLIKEHAYKTRANPSGEKHLDKLLGIENSFLLLQKDVFTFKKEIITITGCDNWKEVIGPFLLY